MSHQETVAAEAAHVANLQLEVQIDAPTDAVWRALTDDIGTWWPSSFMAGSGRDGATGRFFLEAHPGGRMWEDWGDGSGLLWGTVVNLVHGQRLEIVGTSGPEWGGPVTWYGSFKLQSGRDDRGTILTFSEAGFGRIGPGANNEKEAGWRFLFDNLKAHIEGTAPPTWDGGEGSG